MAALAQPARTAAETCGSPGGIGVGCGPIRQSLAKAPLTSVLTTSDSSPSGELPRRRIVVHVVDVRRRENLQQIVATIGPGGAFSEQTNRFTDSARFAVHGPDRFDRRNQRVVELTYPGYDALQPCATAVHLARHLHELSLARRMADQVLVAHDVLRPLAQAGPCTEPGKVEQQHTSDGQKRVRL